MTDDRTLYDALVAADEALYKLWRHLPLNSTFAIKLNELQKQFIQPEIMRGRQKLNPTGKE